MVLISTIIIGLMVFILTMMSGEGCTYLVEESAVEKTDYVFNNILGKEFDSTSPNELVTIEQPKNVLTALLTKCNYDPAETSVGLLSAVGYSNLVNVFAIADSNTIQKALNDSRENVINQIQTLNIANSLPARYNLQNIKDKLEKALENLTISPLIRETTGYKEEISKLEKTCQNLITYDDNSLIDANMKFLSIIYELNGNQRMVDNAHRDLKRLDDGLMLTKSYNEFLKIFDQTLTV
ncbi:unnamed protein product, partial [Hymenolepis diminuta]